MLMFIQLIAHSHAPLLSIGLVFFTKKPTNGWLAFSVGADTVVIYVTMNRMNVTAAASYEIDTIFL